MNVSNTTELANSTGDRAWFQTVRMAQIAGTRPGTIVRRNQQSVDLANEWPGKSYGIRRPDPTETALNWSEINCYRGIQ